MNLFNRGRQNTKRSCLGNAAVAFVLGAIMILCIFVTDAPSQENTNNFLVGAGIMAAVGVYWIYRWYKFDDKDFNDPFHLNR